MKHIESTERANTWVVDYSAARAKAIAWLGDRYLLAQPVNRRPAASGTKSGQWPAAAIARS